MYRSRRPVFFQQSLTPAIRILILINVAVYFVLTFAELGDFGEGNLRFQLALFLGLVPKYFFSGAIWQPFTYMFLHGNFIHILFNMFLLWMFGQQIEAYWGSRGFLKYYFICGIGAGVIVAFAGLVMPSTWAIPTIGASGAIFGILIAYGMLFPDHILLFMFVLPMKVKHAIMIFIAIEFIMLMSVTNHGISNTAHLGGALVGFLYLHFVVRKNWSIRGYLQARKADRIRNRLKLIKFESDDEDSNPRIYH